MARKIAVVTGGAQGIGRTIVERLIAADHDVAIWDANAEVLQATCSDLGPDRVLGAHCDQTILTDVENARAATIDRFGGIDVLVNDAGILGPEASTWQCDPDVWRRVIEVNLVGMYLCSRTVVPVLLDRGWGRIVNMASIAGKEGNPMMSAYSVSKAGVIGLTKSLGKELATTGVLVNAVAPGLVETPMSESASDEIKQRLLAKVPMNRLAKREEVAALVAWLCSDAVSYTTGAVFDISGGRATY